MTARKRRTPWQVVAVEVLLAAACAAAAYGLASLTPAGHNASLVLGGAAGALALRLATRHSGPKRKRSRRNARKPSSARRRS